MLNSHWYPLRFASWAWATYFFFFLNRKVLVAKAQKRGSGRGLVEVGRQRISETHLKQTSWNNNFILKSSNFFRNSKCRLPAAAALGRVCQQQPCILTSIFFPSDELSFACASPSPWIAFQGGPLWTGSHVYEGSAVFIPEVLGLPWWGG